MNHEIALDRGRRKRGLSTSEREGFLGKSLECRQIHKSYGAVKALQDASILVRAGEIRALFGGNGSGKSTLAKILGGTVSPDSGEIFFDGKSVRINSPMDAKKCRIAVTSQELSLFNNLPVDLNLVLSNHTTNKPFRVDSKKVREKSLMQLDRLGLSHIIDRNIDELAGNQKYMLEFAKALAQDPEVLIVDEVTSALFSQDVEIVRRILIELSERGVSVIFISHRMREIFSICQTVTVMRNGATLGTYDLSRISREHLFNLMSGRDKIEEKEEALPVEEEVEATGSEGSARETILSVRNIDCSTFGRCVDLDAMAGEFIGISGLQGQGQSELVRKLFGNLGKVEIEIEGQHRVIDHPYQAIRAGIAFVSGDREKEGTFSDRSIKENLDAVCKTVLGVGEANYTGLINDFGIVVNTINQPIKGLSGGNQQKVVIGRWISMKPKLLLADDPNKGVDVEARGDVHRILKGLIDEGATVIMVSSDDEELVEISRIIERSRILIMYEGKFVKTLTNPGITVQNIVEASLLKDIAV
jgi:ABC-type sugar transport system ATPase subunit